MQRFWKDDPGYIAWLTAHPAGYVLNTYAHITSSYLILHRASCRTVNRPLAANRSWTYAYGKACSDDRSEIEAWAMRETGKPVSPCGHCRPDGFAPVRLPGLAHVGASLGPRAPRPMEAIQFEGEPVRITIDRLGSYTNMAPPLVIEGAQWLAETFFRRDPSSIGQNSYDAWIAETQRDGRRRDEITDEDVTAVNRTMAARTGHAAWAPIVNAGDWPWLVSIHPSWDLFETGDEAWHEAGVSDVLLAAFAATRRTGLHLAVITKVLHIKRPRMFPVLDSVVVQQIGASVSDDIASWVRAMEIIRAVGRSNLAGLREIRSHLEARGIRERPLVRILDALLWVSSPGSGMFGQLTGWERVIRPRTSSPWN
jgi:hypothetical protein